MGHHGRRGRGLHGVGRMVERVLSRLGADGRGVLLQSARRRLARHGRSQEADMTTAAPALSVEGLSVEFRTRSGIVRALDNVSFAVDKGETIALVGESGSGKSVTAYAVMGILDPAGKVTAGRAMLDGLDLLHAKPGQLADVRGRKIAMIFQNPRTALNPIRPVGKQIADVLMRHGKLTRRAAPAAAVEMLRAVGITGPARRGTA